MRIFITGGTGFVGSHLINVLSEYGHELIALKKKDILQKLNRELGKNTIKDIRII